MTQHKSKTLIVLGLVFIAVAVIGFFGALFFLYSLAGNNASALEGIKTVLLVQHLSYAIGLIGIIGLVWGVVKL